MATKNIVVLGASIAGLSVAHYFLKHISPALKAGDSGSTYRVVVIEPSSHFFWRPAAPKATIEPDVTPIDKLFTELKEGFKEYDESSYAIYQGAATALDTTARSVTYKLSVSGESQTISYHSLVICTGITTPTPLTSLHGDHNASIAAIKEMNNTLPNAKEIVISGGGPVGVETAGVIGHKLNGSAGFFASRPSNAKAKITLIAGSTDKLLPMLNNARAHKAEKLLNKVGVDVVYNTRVDKADKDESTGKTTVQLSDGKSLTADVYIPAWGGKPNSSFLPESLRNEHGRVKTDAKTFEVEGGGARVYSIGDVSTASPKGVVMLYDSLPVLMQNMALDLGVEHGKYVGQKDTKVKHKEFVDKIGETQVVPVGTAGVGAFKGYNLPSVMVYWVKGRDFMIGYSGQFTHGTKWKKATW